MNSIHEIRPFHEIKKEYVLKAYYLCNKNKTLTSKKLKLSYRGVMNLLKVYLKDEPVVYTVDNNYKKSTYAA